MNAEQPGGNQPVEKPASEMSVDELQALLAKKQAEQQSAGKQEEVDTSYLEMATGEKLGDVTLPEQAAPMNPEEAEVITERIAEAEGELKANLEEMEGVVSQADQAFAQAEEALMADPDAVEPKLTLEKIRDTYDKGRERLQKATLVLTGTLGPALIGTMIGAGETAPSAFDVESSQQLNEMWVNAMAGSLGALYVTGAAIAIGYAINKFRLKKAESRYFSQKYSQA